MSNYTPIVSYAPKDSLSHGDPNKLIKGAQIDAELAAISTAVATKIDSSFSSPTVQNLSVTSSSIPTNGIYQPSANTVGIATGGVLRATLASTGTVLAAASGSAITGIINPTLSASGGAIGSSQGQTTGVPEATFTTLFTLPNVASVTSAYIVCATAANTADAANYSAAAIVFTNTNTVNFSQIINVPSHFVLQMSGLNLQVRMTTGSGGPYTIQWSTLRIM